ncbi:YHS domain-containing (seleno)protein [Tenacibaculum amylolyticum]|uniref:YHS domain-containing (seleno)protein n=1 Tax=Tenacibaculum amylolyticum TaxID=104269 RepID=UPI0038933B46
MKIFKLTLVITLFLTSLTSFSQDKKANNIDNSNIALQGYSPVSYLDLNLAQRGNKNHKSTYKGVVYYFTSEAQKNTFDSNPKKYLPQYGGYCAFGAYAGAKFRVDPNKFLVINGKYYLFLNNVELDAKQLWLKERNDQKLISAANNNWKKLKKTYN